MEEKRLTNIALTYANDVLCDGAGSQLHRIYGIYALSRAYHIFYVHSPIQKIGYQGIAALEKNEDNLELVDQYNKKFHLDSDIKVPLDAIVTTKFDIEEKDLLEEIEKAAQNPASFFLLRIGSPMRVADARPSVFDHVRHFSPFKKICSSTFRIAIHVRWGDLVVGHEERLLPNQYYIDAAMQAVQVLNKLNIAFVCELHTEMPRKPFFVTPDHHGVKNRIEKFRLKKATLITPQQYGVSDFEVIPHLQQHINKDPIQTLEALATADFFIMSKSSFSYLAALFNQEGKILYAPFWHSRMSAWLQYFPPFLFAECLEEYCEQWLLKRQARDI